MIDPLVSIIVPLHNSERFISATIQSCTSQTYNNIEIIIIENGSSDKSYKIAKSFESEKIKIFQIPKSNAAAARNYGLSKASGDYIQYLDADDILSPNKIASQMQLIKKYGDEYLISCGWGKFREDISEAEFIPQQVWGDFLPVDWLVTSWQDGGMIAIECWLTSRKLIDRAGKWNDKLTLHDDGEFFSRVILKSKKIIFDPQAKIYYRQVHHSLSRNNLSYAAANSSLQVSLSYMRNILQIEDSPRVRNALAYNFVRFLYEYHPNHQSLLETAWAAIKELGIKRIPFVGGRNFKLLAKIA